MSEIAPKSRLPLLLGLLALSAIVLAVDRLWPEDRDDLVAHRLNAHTPQAQAEANARRSPGARSGHPLAHLQLEDFEQIVARPLFAASRRPPDANPDLALIAPGMPHGAGINRHVLVGVVSGPDRSTAILSAGDARFRRVQIGEVVDGWEISDISPTEVTLSSGAQRMVLRLVRNRTAQPQQRDD